MKILYVSQFYYPERAAGAFRAIDNSTIWSRNNNDVTIFTSYPNFPLGKIFNGYSNELISKDEYEGVNLLRNKIIAIKNTSKINRAISSASFVFYSLYNMIFNSKKIGKGYDIVLGTSGTILAPIIAYVYSKINKIPFILELRDITYNQILAVYDNKKAPLYYITKAIEIYLCKKASKIVVVTNGFKSKLIEDGISADKITVIPNGAIVEEDKVYSNGINKEKIIFSYIGNIGGSQNLKRVIDVFNNIKINNKEKELIIIGDGGKKDVIKSYIDQKGISDITLLDGMAYKDLDMYYNKSHFCIVSLNNNDKFIGTIPSKIFTIMSKQRAILFLGPDGEASQIIKDSGCGLVYYSKNYKEIANNISKVINGYVKEDKLELIIKKYGMSGYEFVYKNYNRLDLAEKYLNIMEETIKNHKDNNTGNNSNEGGSDEEENMSVCVE